MSSSISNFSRRGWQMMMAAFLASGMGCWALLFAVFDQPNWKTLAVKSLHGGHELLFFGSSRVFFGINPASFSQHSVNLACDYMDGRSMRDLWKVYGDRFPQVSVVVLEGGLAPYIYDTRTLAPDSLRDLGLSVWPTGRQALTDPTTIIRSAFWPFFRWRLTPDFKYQFDEARSSPNESIVAVAGYVPSRLELTFPEEFAAREIAKARRLREQTAARHEDANRAAYDRLIGELLESGRKVVWLRFPVHRAVQSRYPEAWRQEVAAEKERLRKKHPGLWVIDVWGEDQFRDSDFRDPDHLNEQGASRLAELLSQRYPELFP